MSCTLLRAKLFICGLHIIFILCTLAGCESKEFSQNVERFINPFGGLEEISKNYCKTACGQTKHLFASVIKRYCQLKCPNSTLAQIPLKPLKPTTDNGHSKTPVPSTSTTENTKPSVSFTPPKVIETTDDKTGVQSTSKKPATEIRSTTKKTDKPKPTAKPPKTTTPLTTTIKPGEITTEKPSTTINTEKPTTTINTEKPTTTINTEKPTTTVNTEKPTTTINTEKPTTTINTEKPTTTIDTEKPTTTTIDTEKPNTTTAQPITTTADGTTINETTPMAP